MHLYHMCTYHRYLLINCDGRKEDNVHGTDIICRFAEPFLCWQVAIVNRNNKLLAAVSLGLDVTQIHRVYQKVYVSFVMTGRRLLILGRRSRC